MGTWMSDKYFVVRESDDVIINIVMWDGISPWRPDTGQYLEPFHNGVGIGFGKVDGQWIDVRPRELEVIDVEEIPPTPELGA